MSGSLLARTRTKRVIRAECLLCGAELEIEVENLYGDPQEFIDSLSLSQWEGVHAEHERRARTRTLT